MIDEGFPHLACGTLFTVHFSSLTHFAELLATSIIMRHIVEYNLEV